MLKSPLLTYWTSGTCTSDSVLRVRRLAQRERSGGGGTRTPVLRSRFGSISGRSRRFVVRYAPRTGALRVPQPDQFPPRYSGAPEGLSLLHDAPSGTQALPGERRPSFG